MKRNSICNTQLWIFETQLRTMGKFWNGMHKAELVESRGLSVSREISSALRL